MTREVVDEENNRPVLSNHLLVEPDDKPELFFSKNLIK